MSGRGRNKDVCTGHAVEFLLRCQGAKVSEAMRAAKFTLEESLDRTKQMDVRRAYTKATGGKKSLSSQYQLMPLPWYAKSLNKTNGLSSYQISNKVKIEFNGVGK